MDEFHSWISDGGSSKQDLTGISGFLCSAVSWLLKLFRTMVHAVYNSAAGSV